MIPARSTERLPHSSNSQESLQSTFHHPASLQTARSLAQAVATNSFSRSAHHTSTVSKSSDPRPGAEGMLSSILMLKDSQSQKSPKGLRHVARTMTSRDAMDVVGDAGVAPPAPFSSFARSDMLGRQTNHHTVLARNLHPSCAPSSSRDNGQLPSAPRSYPQDLNPHKTPLDKSPESEIRSIFGGKVAVGNSRLHGSESPYRVESPAVQAPFTAPLPPSAQISHREDRPLTFATARESAGRGAHFSVADWDDEPIRRVLANDLRGSVYGRPHSPQELEGKNAGGATRPLTELADSPCYPSLESLVPTSSPSYVLPYAGLPGIQIQPSALAKVSPTFQSFLLVNKPATSKKEKTRRRRVHNKRPSQSEIATIANPPVLSEAEEPPPQEHLSSSLHSPSPPPAFSTPPPLSPHLASTDLPTLPTDLPSLRTDLPTLPTNLPAVPTEDPPTEDAPLTEDPPTEDPPTEAPSTEAPETELPFSASETVSPTPIGSPEPPSSSPSSSFSSRAPSPFPLEEFQSPRLPPVQTPPPPILEAEFASLLLPSAEFPFLPFPLSPHITDHSSPDTSDNELDLPGPRSKMQPRKRKAGADLADARAKKQRVNEPTKKGMKRGGKGKERRHQKAKEKLPQAIIMRILEFTPPSFLSKARLISKSFKSMVDEFDSIFVNCRKENFGWDMPAPPKGLTERQYSDLFGGKGCLEPGCRDELCSRTHWSWAKRWCQECWKSKIEREDRALKKWQGQYGRVTLTKLFECIPVGIHDSFLKPHDYIDNFESRSRQAPRLYKYYLSSDIEQVINDYEALTPAPFVEDPTLSPAENAAGRAAHQVLMSELEEKRNQFFTDRKKENDDHMAKVQKIETAIKEKREEDRKPNNENRDARKALFIRRAREDLPQIPTEFVRETKAFKAATRIFRDPGSERGWQTLKPKIEEAWVEAEKKRREEGVSAIGLDGAADADEAEVVVAAEPAAQETVVLEPQPHRPSVLHRSRYTTLLNFSSPSPSITDLGSSMSYRNSLVASRLQHGSGMYPNNAFHRNPSNMNYGGGFLSQAGYGNAAQQFHPNHLGHYPPHMMSSHPMNNYSQISHNHNTHHGAYQPRRDMSIQSVLSEPVRLPFASHQNFRQP